MAEKMNRSLAISLAIAGAASVMMYTIYRLWKTNKMKEADEGFSEKAGGEPLPKKILILGLDGAGKSCLLNCFSGKPNADTYEPTDGFNVSSMKDSKVSLELHEIGGKPDFRKYWMNFVQDTEVLVFVVDAADRDRFCDAYTEMHKLLGEDRLLEKPFVVIANKQDIFGAATKPEIKEALGLEDVKHHRVQIVETTLNPIAHSSTAHIKRLLLDLTNSSRGSLF